MPKKRSKGIAILSVWLMLSAVMGVLGSIIAGHLAAPLMGSLNLGWLAVEFACGIGLLRLKEWARKAAIAFYAFSMAFGTLSLFTTGFAQLEEVVPDITPEQKTVSYILAFVIYLAWFLVIAFFLTRPKVKEQFN